MDENNENILSVKLFDHFYIKSKPIIDLIDISCGGKL